MTRSVAVDSSLLGPFVVFFRGSRQAIAERDQDYTSSIKTAVGLKYVSPSDCWGLQFAREKNYNTLEEAASYVLRLSVLFMGQERPMPDMSNGVMKLAH